MKQCEYLGCDSGAKFGMFKLNADGTKTWINLCNFHDREVDYYNRIIRELHPGMTWQEVKSENHNNLQAAEN
jgi:hypothetical protein